jgi:hypothetical protein
LPLNSHKLKYLRTASHDFASKASKISYTLLLDSFFGFSILDKIFLAAFLDGGSADSGNLITFQRSQNLLANTIYNSHLQAKHASTW